MRAQTNKTFAVPIWLLFLVFHLDFIDFNSYRILFFCCLFNLNVMLSAPVALMLLKFESDQYDRRWRESEKADSSDITNIEEDIE